MHYRSTVLSVTALHSFGTLLERTLSQRRGCKAAAAGEAHGLTTELVRCADVFNAIFQHGAGSGADHNNGLGQYGAWHY